MTNELAFAPALNREPSLLALAAAINSYAYPSIVYDFESKREITFTGMREVECFIGEQLTSSDPEVVRDGLSNVLFWGYYRSPGRRDDRVKRFRAGVTPRQLRLTVDVFSSLQGCAICDLKRLKLPQFTNLSFLSKLRTFLAPSSYCVIDLKLLTIPTLSQRFKVYRALKPTSIPATHSNEESYFWWVSQCRTAARLVRLSEQVRPVDAERGFFQMVDSGKTDLADALLRQLEQGLSDRIE